MKRTRGLRRKTLVLTAAAVLAATFLIPWSASLSAQQATTYKEDINGDGLVNLRDVISLILLGKSDPTNAKADYDSSGAFNIRDVVMLARNIINGNLTVVVPTPPPPTNKTVIVEMRDFYFSPDSIMIAPGDTVEWSNVSTATHTSTSGTNCSPNNIWNSGNVTPGNTFTFVFATAGDYPYYCIPHCSLGMKGKVVVVAP